MSWLFVLGKGWGVSFRDSGPADAGALSGTISFLKASLPLFLPAVDEPWPVSSMPDAWKEAAVGTAAVDLRAKEAMLVNDRVERLVLSTN